MIHILPAPKKITFFEREYLYNGETVHTSLNILLGEEAYILEISSVNGISIVGGSEKAVFYGECTLEQILHSCKGKLPELKIEDEPAFAYRGFMIDCARHHFSMEELKAIIDTMAKLKYNKFHWHLSDDQGFRMQIDALPKLHEEGAVRRGSYFGRVHLNNRYGGYYTKEQMRELVAFCAERYIDVIPELDFPGHSSAMIHAYPEISCRGKKIEVETRQGIFKNILCAGNEYTYEFLFKVLDEMCDIFPADTFHLGGDEVPKDSWEHCSHCKKMLRENALENFEQLQGLMMNRVARYLQEKGKQVICWNESLKGGNLDKAFIVERWMDYKQRTVAWANSGRKVIMGDFYHTYFDYPYEMTPLKKVFSYSPYIKRMDVRGKENVLGVECCLWSEHISDNASLEYMLFPRACAVANTAWGYQRADYAYFVKALENFLFVFKQNAIQFATKRHWNPLPHRRVAGTIRFFNNIRPRSIRS